MTTDFWNFADISLIFIYIAYFVTSFLYLPTDYRITGLQCSIIFIFAIKINFYLRLFEGFGFLVQMIVTTFRDIGYFLLYFFILLAFMAIQIFLIMDKELEGYDGIGSVKWYVIALQLNIADNLESSTNRYILFWLIWFLQFIVGNIVLMNFLIAVVGNSFSDCMAKREAQTLKVKVDMIYEREFIMSAKELENENHFPQYILVRKTVEASEIETTHLEQITMMLRDTQYLAEKVPRLEENILQISKLLTEAQQTIHKTHESTTVKIDRMNMKLQNQVS